MCCNTITTNLQIQSEDFAVGTAGTGKPVFLYASDFGAMRFNAGAKVIVKEIQVSMFVIDVPNNNVIQCRIQDWYLELNFLTVMDPGVFPEMVTLPPLEFINVESFPTIFPVPGSQAWLSVDSLRPNIKPDIECNGLAIQGACNVINIDAGSISRIVGFIMIKYEIVK